ncbi:hypothetical protein ACFY5J_00440 [Peribacillus butanolivorans]|uniref:hypothetical protein n=1 Tax=Peribacillus butanolivorans TaxID=421767 RepID=UPI0036A9F55E
MGLQSKTDNQVEKIYDKAYKEHDYSTVRKTEREMEDRGYKQSMGGWAKDNAKNSTESEALPVRGNITLPGLIFIVLLASLLMNFSLIMVMIMLIPAAMFVFTKNQAVRAIFSMIPLFFALFLPLYVLFIGEWAFIGFAVVLVPFTKLKEYFNVHLFAFIVSGYVLVSNFIRINNIRIEKNLSVEDIIFDYDWLHILAHADNALSWSIGIYIVCYGVPRFFRKSNKKVIQQKDVA